MTPEEAVKAYNALIDKYVYPERDPFYQKWLMLKDMVAVHEGKSAVATFDGKRIEPVAALDPNQPLVEFKFIPGLPKILDTEEKIVDFLKNPPAYSNSYSSPPRIDPSLYEVVAACKCYVCDRQRNCKRSAGGQWVCSPCLDEHHA